MGTAEPAVGEREDQARAELRFALCPGALGECLEDSHPGVGLHLGCGKKLWPGWTNIDLETGDVKADIRRLPVETEHADVAIAIHVLEHFYFWEVADLLTEWKRVLKPGGKLILELPCMDKVLFYMSECLRQKAPMDPQMTWLALWGDPGYRRVEMCHKWGYTKQMLTDALLQAGFVNVAIEKPRYHVPPRDMRVVAFKETA